MVHGPGLAILTRGAVDARIKEVLGELRQAQGGKEVAGFGDRPERLWGNPWPASPRGGHAGRQFALATWGGVVCRWLPWLPVRVCHWLPTGCQGLHPRGQRLQLVLESIESGGHGGYRRREFYRALGRVWLP